MAAQRSAVQYRAVRGLAVCVPWARGCRRRYERRRSDGEAEAEPAWDLQFAVNFDVGDVRRLPTALDFGSGQVFAVRY